MSQGYYHEFFLQVERWTIRSASMMIHTRTNGDRPELARHFDEACDGRLEHQRAKLGRRGGRVPADSLFREAAPPILPRVRARFGVIPVEVFQFGLTDVSLCLVHLHEFGEGVKHHGGLVFARVTYASPSALAVGIQHVSDERRVDRALIVVFAQMIPVSSTTLRAASSQMA